MSIFNTIPDIPIQFIQDSLLEEKGIILAIKREDQIHPEISGNKWRKLKYNFKEAKSKDYQKVLTFGGAYSNHIAATAACAALEGLESVGIIRGEELDHNSNATLKLAYEKGMKLHFVSRSDYRRRNESSFIKEIKQLYGNFYLIPEGGTNALAVKGTQEIMDQSSQEFDIVAVSAGTGGTAAGVIKGQREGQQTLVFSSLSGDFLEAETTKWAEVGSGKYWTFINQYHFGGYAKWNYELIDFINQFKLQHGIPLDPIYTGKLLFGLYDLIRKDYFKNPAKILAIHTGGLQGIQGFNEKNGFLLK